MADQNKIVYNIKVNAEQGTATIRDLKGQIVATQVPVDQLRGKFGNFASQVNAVKFDKFNKGLKSATAANRGLAGASGGATTSVLELGRVVSDAPYGIRGMANNVSQLASNMLFTSQQIDKTTGKAIGFNGVLKDMSKVFMGPLGILFVIQGAIAALDYFYGAAKKAEKSISDLTSKTYAGSLVAKGYVEELENVNISEDRRAVVTQELIKLVPTLTEADLKYGANLDKVRLKIKSYALAQASRIQIDNLVQENSEVLAAKNELESIKQIEDSEKRLERMKKFILETGADISGFYLGFGQEGLINKGNVDATEEEFKRLGRIIDKESEPIIERISELTTALELDPSKSKGKGKGKKAKKISPFKTPKELDIDVKNVDNAVIQYERRLQDARLKKELNDKLSEATSEEEKAKIRRNYERDRLINQMNAEEDILKLKKANEEAVVKTKTKNHTDELKRKFELFTTELDYQQKLGKISKEDSESLKSDAAGKLFDGLAQAQTEEKVSLDEISNKYKPIFTLFSSLKAARLDALFSKDSGEGSEDSTEMEKLEAFVSRYMEISGVLTDFMNGEFNRQLTIEQNKTNALNNELRERLNNENLSADERKDIQLRIARNDEALRRRQEQIKKKQFKLNKAANIASALVSTYSGASAAYFNTLKNPANALDPTAGLVRAKINAGVATALGLANVAMIARQKFQSSISTAPSAGALGGGGGSGSGTGDRSFNFNLAGASQENQLAQTLQGRFDQPLQAYVVSRDITNQQQLDLDIENNASFG